MEEEPLTPWDPILVTGADLPGRTKRGVWDRPPEPEPKQPIGLLVLLVISVAVLIVGIVGAVIVH